MGMTSTDRLVVRFDTVSARAFIAQGPNKGKPIGTVLHYIETPRKTPTGGRYVAKQFTLRTPNGRKWFGTMKSDSDIVRCRPAQ